MRRRASIFALAALAGVFAVSQASLGERLMNALLYFPLRDVDVTPAALGLAFEDVAFESADGESLHGFLVRALEGPPLAHVLICHGNAGSVADRVVHLRLLAEAGFDAFVFDYRGYGRSSGSPTEAGTYADARAARQALLARPGISGERMLYLGESLGGGVALALALEQPPAGLVLQSSFTSVHEMARLHYPFVPRAIVPDAYPSLSRIAALQAPLLVLHGDRDDIVPIAHGQALHAAAPQPKQLRVFAGVGHNDLVSPEWAAAIADWARALRFGAASGALVDSAASGERP